MSKIHDNYIQHSPSEKQRRKKLLIEDVTMDFDRVFYEEMKRISKKTGKTIKDMVQEAVKARYFDDVYLPNCVEKVSTPPSFFKEDLMWLKARDKELNDRLHYELRKRLDKIDKNIRLIKRKKSLTLKEQVEIHESCIVEKSTQEIIKEHEEETNRLLEDPPTHVFAMRLAYHMAYMIDWLLRDDVLKDLSKVRELKCLASIQNTGETDHGAAAVFFLKRARTCLMKWGRYLGKDWRRGKIHLVPDQDIDENELELVEAAEEAAIEREATSDDQQVQAGDSELL
jgi:predicted DNA-binding protein